MENIFSESHKIFLEENDLQFPLLVSWRHKNMQFLLYRFINYFLLHISFYTCITSESNSFFLNTLTHKRSHFIKYILAIEYLSRETDVLGGLDLA